MDPAGLQDALLADLHVHSNASDGRREPAQVVEEARASGLRVVALTDHDTVAGIAAAQEAGRRMGVEVIPGLEVSAAWAGHEVHLLGYFVDVHSPALARHVALFQRQRRRRARLMVSRLAALGYPVEWARVRELAGSGSVGRPHVARALLEKGYVGRLNQAFDQFLAEGRPAYVPHARLSVREGIRLIGAAGGVAVLAHPYLAQVDGLIPLMRGQGLVGLEVAHPSHGPSEQERYLRLARHLGLLPTGGSDAHGSAGPHDQPGRVRIPLSWVEDLRARAAPSPHA
ncbi:PHP domain-containing protein [Limnochorda pilosa]|uniref:Phosphotransferase n=1 Tax=Limnochorda pilosa TaxID=1555112 RepID=A0A0K2SKD1_LIMPI|nr:PHP domain-containing protein [Limnochorda pilosa]BAS27555.1 phosphotransferase [Limnochorda pilosa]